MKEKLIWDTTLDPIDYPVQIKNKFFELSIKHRKNFVDWIGKISDNFTDDYLWWIKLPSSRDPYKSDLFKNIIIILILKNNKLLNKIDTIVFENELILKAIQKDNKISLKKIRIKFKKKRYFYNLLKSIIFSFVNFFIIKMITKKNFFFNKDYVLINTIINTKNENQDYVFPGLDKILNKKKKKHVLFVPSFLVHGKFLNIYKNIKKLSKQRYIFIENWISYYDFFGYLFKHLFSNRLNENKNKFEKFFSCDCSLLIASDFNSKVDFYSEFQSILRIKFIEKLSKQDLKVIKTISRFENQSIDRSWFYGFRNFFPKTKNLGFQGFLYYPQLVNQSPTFYENKAKVIPDLLLVPNNSIFRHRKEFFKKINLKIGPSFKNHDLKRNKRNKKNNKFTFALCGIYSLDKNIILWLVFSLQRNKNIKVIVKPHPILPIHKLIALIPEHLLSRITISNDSVTNLLKKTQFLISSGPTSIIFESLLYGCKLLYLNLDPNDFFIYKKKLINKNNFEFVKDRNSLLKLMTKLNNFSKPHLNKFSVNFLYSRLSNKNTKFFY